MPKYILQEMPDMQGDGKRKVYPKLDAYRLLDTEDFVKEVHNEIDSLCSHDRLYNYSGCANLFDAYQCNTFECTD